MKDADPGLKATTGLTASQSSQQQVSSSQGVLSASQGSQQVSAEGEASRTMDFSPRFWSHSDAVGAVLTLAAFCLIVSILVLAGGLDPEISQTVSNYKGHGGHGRDILVLCALWTAFFAILLTLPLFLACSTHFMGTQQEELLYIVGINQAEEEEGPQPSQSRDKLGKDQEEKWTYNSSKKSEMFGTGTDLKGMWTFGQFQKLAN